jgi:hypothetical protein
MRQWLIMAVLVVLFGCSAKSEPEAKPLKTITLEEVYPSPSSITAVDRIELRDMSTGNRLSITDQKQILDFINQIKGLKLVPDEEQGLRVGNIYKISMYEGEDLKLGFVSDAVNGVNYINLEFQDRIHDFFEQQFGRDF